MKRKDYIGAYADFALRITTPNHIGAYADFALRITTPNHIGAYVPVQNNNVLSFAKDSREEFYKTVFDIVKNYENTKTDPK